MTAYFHCPDNTPAKALRALNCLLLAIAVLVLHPISGGATPPKNGIAPPNWTVDAAGYQFSMNIVIRVKYNGASSNAAGNMVGVFVGNELRGMAPALTVGGEVYYFVTVYSNQYTGETLRFRTYYAADDKVYSTLESVSFTHHGYIGSRLSPFWININPNIDFAPEIIPIPADTTLQNIPFAPINLSDYLLSLDGDPVSWSVLGGANLTATVVNGVLTVSPLSPAWTGTDLVTITATENTANHYLYTRTASFTVLPDYGPPALQPVPPQTIFPDGGFTPFDLDDYLTFNGPCRAFELKTFPFSGTVADPAWPAVPPGAQPMTIVARPLFADQTLAGAGTQLAAFVNNVLVGSAAPTGISPNIFYSISLQNLAAGPVTFRLYHADHQYLYEKTTTLAFMPGASVGSIANPYLLQFSPLLPTLDANGGVEVLIVDSTWRGTYPVDFIVRDCSYPLVRRDTVSTTFSIEEDNGPHFTSGPTAIFLEQACRVLYDAQSTDPHEAEAGGLVYSITGGADAAKFAIDPVSGLLSWFNFSPDFEAPGDADGNNQYEVTIRVTNSVNLSDELALTVTVADNPQEPFQPLVNGGVTAVCFSGNTTLEASGGGTYLWSNNSSGSSISITTSGTYTVTITSTGGCTASVVVTASKGPTISATGGSGIVCIGSNINLGSTPAGGSGNYTQFAWAGPNAFGANVEDPVPFPASASAGGVYTVTVTDNAGCTATSTTNVVVSGSSAPAISASNTGPVCAGANVLLSSSPSGGSGTYSQFKWSGPNGYSASLQNPFSLVASGSAAGVYTVTLTDNAGCTATGTTQVQVNAVPSITAMSNSPVCTGSAVLLTSTPSGSSGYGFHWAGPNGYSANQEDPAGFAAALAGAGTYTVTVSNGTGCTATATTVVSVSGLPSITAALLGPVCTGGSVALGSTPSGGSGIYSQFQWSGPGGYSATAEDPAPFGVVPAVAGTYTVTVTDQTGCTATANTSVVIHPVPGIAVSNNGPVCQGSSLQLASTPSGGSGAYTLFQWTGPDNYVATVEDPVAFTTTPASAGVYQVKVTDNQGCSATATASVAVNPRPTVTATSNSPVCLSANIDLQSTPTGGSGVYTAFSWTGPNAYSSMQQTPIGFAAGLANKGTYTVTVTDNTGCTATASTSVAVSNNPAPAIVVMSNSPICGGSILQLGVTPSGGSGTYSQYNWSGPNGFSAGIKTPPGFVANAAASGTYSVTVTDSKGCLGTNSVTVAVNVPTATPGANSPICLGTTVLLHAGAAAGSGVYTGYAWAGPGGYSASVENPPGFVATTGNMGTYTVTVTDNTGCTGSGTVVVSFQNNAPPTIDCPANQEVTANDACTAMLGSWVSSASNVTDDCTPPGSILVTQAPAEGTLLSGHNDQRTVTLKADDGTGNTTMCTFTVTLKDETPPTISCPADQTVVADGQCAGTVGNRIGQATNLTDNCTAPGAIGVTQSPLDGTVLSGHDDQKIVTLTADDGHENTTTCTFKVTLKDMTPPTITCPPDQTVAADAFCAGTVGNRVGQATNLTDNCTAPDAIWVTQSPLAGTVLSGHNDQKTVMLTADDGHENTTTCSFKVTLKDVTPPAITCPVPVTVSCAGNVPAPNINQVTATDNCGPVTKEHLFTTLPYEFTCVNRFKLTRTYRAADGVGNSSTCTQVITVFDNTLPTFTSLPANVTVQCNAIPTVGKPAASDNCGGSVGITYNGQTVSAIVCPDTYTLTRQWTATDACGNTKTATQKITVQDTQKPVFTSLPANVTVQCNAIPAVGNPAATDNCDLSVTVGYNGETRTNGFCPDTYVLTRKWTAVDNCGNTQTATQKITVQDTQKPVFTSVPAEVTIECTAPVPAVGTPVATDNCDASVTITYLGQTSTNAICDNSYQIQRSWLAADNCGNTTAVTQTITVQDTHPPTFTSVPANVTVQCSDLLPAIGTPTATDACGGYVQITFLGQVRTNGSCLYNYILTRTWRAQDLCGNSVTASQAITVQDTHVPTFNSPPANVTVDCPNIPDVPTLTAQDNCGPAMVSYLGQTQGPGSCASGFVITRTWTAVDICGNVGTFTHTINVLPTMAPNRGADKGDPPVPAPNAGGWEMRLTPNPARGEVWVGFEQAATTDATLLLLDVGGRLVLRQDFQTVTGNNGYRIDLTGIPAGIYSVQLRAGGPAMTSKLLIFEW